MEEDWEAGSLGRGRGPYCLIHKMQKWRPVGGQGAAQLGSRLLYTLSSPYVPLAVSPQAPLLPACHLIALHWVSNVFNMASKSGPSRHQRPFSRDSTESPRLTNSDSQPECVSGPYTLNPSAGVPIPG